jgi:polysaccharide export outer membrane protein
MLHLIVLKQRYYTVNTPLIAVSTALLLATCFSASAQSGSSSQGFQNGSTQPSQPLGPDDLVQVQVLNFPEFSRAVRVSADGSVTLPLVRKPLSIRGKLPVEVEALIRDTLRSEDLVVNPTVSVTVVEYASRPVSVIGSVRTPLIFQAVGRVTLSDAIIRAGGFTPDAGPELLLTRQAPDLAPDQIRPTRHILIRTLLQSDSNEANVLLTGHEEIRVPPAGKLYVLGDVKAPGQYPVTDQTDTTVLKVLSLSGGLGSSPAKEAWVIRRDEVTGTKHQIPIDLHAILARQVADYPLIPDDILFIPDNRKRKETLAILDRIVTFGAAIGTGLIIYSAGR